MRIGNRLILHTVIVAFFSVVVTSICIGWMSYSFGYKALYKEQQEDLIAIRDIKKHEIERYFSNIRNQLLAFASDRMIIDAMVDFKKDFSTYASEVGVAEVGEYRTNVIRRYIDDFSKEYYRRNGIGVNLDVAKLLNVLDGTSFGLQYRYILENPNPLEHKGELIDSKDGSTYNEHHKKYHPSVLNFLKKFGYHDIFLVDSDTGDIVYTVFKELEFTTSLKDGIFAETALGRVFREANAATTPEYIAVSDYEPSLASYNDQAAFMATPVYQDGKKVGILIFQLPIDVINDIMTNGKQWKEEGFGDTGETYIVGPDFLLRSMSRFFVESPENYLNLMKKLGVSTEVLSAMEAKDTSIGLQSVVTNGVKSAFQGKTGFDAYADYRDVPVLAAYAPLNIPGLNWVILSESDEVEVFAPIRALFKHIVIITPLIALALIVIAIYGGISLARKISQPIEKFSSVIRILSDEQDLTKRILVKTKDELGEMADALNQLLESLQETFQETLNSSRVVRAKGYELRELSDSMVDRGGHVEDSEVVARTGEELQDLSGRIESLTGQFKVLEEEAEREEDW